ncbi:MAG: leucine-rich repeat domain-containing protein [Alistipes sp.]|nr:leucine-rich repeat domain-containing protein [Alistipes sp.]
MKKLLTFLLTTAVLFTTACTNSDDSANSNTDPTPEKPKTEIKLETRSLDFTTEGGRDEISITSTESWTAEVINSRADSWLSVSPTSGNAGDATLTITAKNNDTTDERSASVRIKAGSAQKIINVTQKQKDALTITSSKFEITAEGGEVTIEVKANIKFEYTIDESAKGWVKYEGTRAMKTSILTFSVAENEDSEKREAKIYITSGDLNETITIYQEGSKPSIIISQNEYIVPSDGGTIAVDVKSNIDVAVELPADVDWISENTTRAFSTNTYRFDIQPNDSHDNRSTEIKFTNKENGLSEVVAIKQMQRDAIVLADSEYEFGIDGGNLVFEIQTNVDITVTISDNAKEWIQQVETRTLETKTLYFNVSERSDIEDREGTITISGGSATQTIKVTQSGLKEILEKEREALIAFYEATGGDNWTRNDNWCSDKPVSEWHGVNVDEFMMPINSKRVVTIRLNGFELTGNIPEEIAELEQLTVLDLSINKLTGNIPEEIAELEQLTVLNLGGNMLEGEIPASLGALSNLEYLELFANKLTGEIPWEITNLPSLKTLSLFGNLLTGEIPEKISDLSQLKSLDLSSNLLFGEIPASLGTLSNLEQLSITNNNLSGNIPKEIGSLTNLKNLYLSGNALTGSIPSEITKLTQLEYLWLNRNELNGELPTDIGNMVALRELNLQFNQISGEIPNSLGNLKNLESLILSVNSISGTIPTSISGLENIGWLDLMGNQLSGEIPSEIGSLSKLKHLNLGGNKLCGEIPTALVNCVSLEDLRLFDNNLTGNIPKELGNIELLTVLSIGSNNFTGTIPKELSELDKLVELALDNNLLTGGIPEEFVNLKSLKYLYLSNNNLSGECSEDLSNFIYNLDYFELNQKEGYEIILNTEGSVDYTMDGHVVTLQTHTKGDGASFVITMDGFTDKQIASGEADVHVQRCYNALFAVEPYASFKDYFDVYVVYSVSKKSGLGNGSALETEYAGDMYDLGIEKIEEYIMKIPNKSNEIHGIAILNDMSWRRDMCYWMPYGSISSASIGNYDEEIPEDFVRTIHHEILGHGFGRLGDEYVETTDTTFSNYPEEEKQVIWDEHKRGWYLNVDVTNDPERVVWKDFLSNPNYASENIGIYEGALYYKKGAYRSTYTSIMRDGSGTTFNAPSRWAIYKHIMEIAGEEYSFDTFLEYDKKNIGQTSSAVTRSAQSAPINPSKLGAKPRFLNR